MKILYNINLEDYQIIQMRNYLNYSTIEIANNLLFADVAFVDEKGQNTLFFKAEILKLFIDLNQVLEKIKLGEIENEMIFSTDQNYMFNIEINKKFIVLNYNKNKILKYDFKKFQLELARNTKKIFSDFKILYPNYKDIKNIDFLVKSLSRF
ncbi:hypothetical protein ACFSX9_10680 [Flavobacterium ardleyense]|uniref:Uncharacterized protein n=1 Tax=Flavobacterium ardleyense TaxID=2038737 RepID=A0ABW5Z8I8_9FLAO